MRCEILTDFKDGYDQFTAGEIREIDAERAARFAGYGWLRAAGVATAEPHLGDATLTIHDGRHAQQSEVN